MQEIKTNEPFLLDGKMVKIVECEKSEKFYSNMVEPKKERWFKCIADYTSLKRNIPYKGSFVNSLGRTVESLAEQWPNDFEEIQPDFVCQHSGEGFMKGDECYFTDPSYLNSIEEGMIILECEMPKKYNYLIYFHAREDALAWQEKKFGKKEENLLKEAEEIFERHWVKRTQKPLDKATKYHMMYCIEAIQEALNKGGK